MRFKRTLITMIVFGSIASISHAQSDSFFNGNGIKMDRAEPGRTTMFDFSRLAPQPAAETKAAFKFPKLEMPKWQAPKWNLSNIFQPKKYPKPILLTDQSHKASVYELPMWNPFLERNFDQPSFFQRMSDRNKQLWGRTKETFSSWTSEDKEQSTEKGFDTWDRITRGFNPDSSQGKPTAQPSLRTGQQKGGQATIRY